MEGTPAASDVRQNCVQAIGHGTLICRGQQYRKLAVSPRRPGGGSKTEQNELYGFASFSGLNV